MALPFLLCRLEMNNMMAHWIKSLIKCSLDNIVLPGTLTGTEIMWLYMIQWKRDMSTLSFALIYFVCSQFDFTPDDNSVSNTPGNHKETVD